MSKQTNKNQLVKDVGNYDVNKMIFADPVICAVPNSAIKYTRVPISTLNADGTIGDLVLGTERVFSFGVQVNKDPKTQEAIGHALSLCLWTLGGATQPEKAWVEGFGRIVDHCKKYLIKNKHEFGKHNLSMELLDHLNPVYWKREKTTGQIVEGTGPTLYVKLIASKKLNKILTLFSDIQGQTLDPLELMGKRCHVNAAVKIESIYVGKNISLQIKLYEAVVEPIETKMQPMLSRPKPSGSGLLMGNATNINEIKDEDETGSVGNSDDELTTSLETKAKIEDKKPAPTTVKVEDPAPAPKKVVKKIVAKKV